MPLRRTFAGHLMAIALLPASHAVRAQGNAGRVPRIGVLMAEPLADQASRLDALRAGLQDVGYKADRDLVFDVRSAEGHYDRLANLAVELVQRKVDLIVAFGIKALVAARQATGTLPIVIPATSSDLVAMKLITSLSRPGGNITGLTTFGSEVMAERLELVRDVLPRASRVAVLVNPANTSFAPTYRQMDSTARSLKVSLLVQQAASPNDLDRAFEAMSRDRADALVVQDDTLFAAQATALATLAAKHRLPMVGGHGLAEAGGLIGYGRNENALYRRSAHYIDRILKGSTPATLPIEQATRFELWLNLRSANALGLRLPEALLIRADNTLR